MPREITSLQAFNRGKISTLGLARTDLDRTRLSAEVQTNYIPRVLGAMSFRPGWKYLGSVLSDARAFFIPFVFSTDDTALLEFTDSHMRVWKNDAVTQVTGSSVSVVNGDFTGTEPVIGTKLTDPTLSAVSETDIAWSPDGSVCLQTGTASPYVNAIALSGSTAVAITPPVVTAQINGVCFHPDGTRLYISNSSNVSIYSVTGTGVSMAFVFLTNISPAPSVTPGHIDITDDGAMIAVAHASASTTCEIYYKTDDTYTTVTGPVLTWAAAIATGISVSHDGKYLAVTSGTTPYVNVFVISGADGSWVFTKLTNPGTLPTGAATDVSIAPDNTAVAVSHTTTPYVTIYTLSGSATPVKITNPGTLPTGNGSGVHYAPNNDYLAVSHTTTPFITIYTRSGTTYTKITNPGTLPAANAKGTRFNQTERHLAVITGSSPTLVLYDWAIWNDSDQSGATSSYTAGVATFTGTAFNSAIIRQWVGVPVASLNLPVQLRFVVTKGYIDLRIGSSLGKEDYLSLVTLKVGTHSFTVTPTIGHLVIELASSTQYSSTMNGITVESGGALDLPTIWEEADLTNLRYTQSGDIVFVACKSKRPQQIERRGTTSWSIVDYVTDDGPFRVENTTGITMAPSALTGDVTITASQNYFKSTNVDGLIKITSIGQTASSSLTGANQFTDEIKVIGTGTSRNFSVTRSGTWSGTLTIQRSIAEPGAWADTTTTYTTNGTVTFNDALDNQIIYYRIGFKTGDYTSGTAVVTLQYDSGGIEGIARIDVFNSETSVNAHVLKAFGSTDASTTWSEGDWSTRRGFPSSVALYEGRMWWAGKDNVWGSISDAFASFDESQEGDSGPINRSIGEGPVDTINWLLPLQRLLVGGQGAEFSIRSTSFDELLTPDNFNIKTLSTQGSQAVQAEKVDSGGFYVQQGGTRVFELAYNSDTYDYDSADKTMLCPEQCLAGIIRMDIQRKPDTRLHCVLGDGTVGLMVYDKAEEVIAWVDIETDGTVEDVVILPSTPEDAVYYVVNRTINGHTKRYLERWALGSEAIGGLINKMADSFILYDSTPTTTITGLDSLEGEEVVAWGDGIYDGTFTVSSGSITLPDARSQVVVGLTYRGRYKSSKLAYAAEDDSALNATKRIPQVALVLANTHRYGVTFGGDFDHLDDLPGVEGGADISSDYVWDQYDEDKVPLNGDWGTDGRLCLESNAPKPATILAVTLTVETNARTQAVYQR